jgi:IclR family pca regulon transcriptional regulator
MPHDDSASSQSLERGLAILGAFTPDCPTLGISELAQRLGLTRSTTHRYVATLAKLGYLDQDDVTRKYRLPSACSTSGSPCSARSACAR